MTRAHVVMIVSSALGAVALGCSDEDNHAGPPSSSAGTGGTGGTGGSSAGGAGGSGGSVAGSDGGGVAGAAAQDGAAGSGASATGGSGAAPAVCGDGQLGAGEQCDGSEFGGKTCVDFGFETGALICTGCTIDWSRCSGTEQCYDGRDNDGDGEIDCGDPDCATLCVSACQNPPVLSDPGSVSADTTTHPALTKPGCFIADLPSGPELAYRFTAAQSGVLDVLLTSGTFGLGVAVRSDCNSAASELACTLGRRIITPITKAQTVFIVVDGIDTGNAGPFQLDARSRPTVCGDGNRDPGEACDDGNTASGDGCSASCTVEASESEPNDSTANADPLVTPFFAVLSSGSDVDVVQVSFTQTSSLVVDVADYGDRACEYLQLDSVVEILDSSSTVIAWDDDSGPGLCSHAVAGSLAPGTYYIRVSAAPGSGGFPYVLRTLVDPCGNDFKSEGEECDDGNNVSYDGCSAICKLE